LHWTRGSLYCGGGIIYTIVVLSIQHEPHRNAEKFDRDGYVAPLDILSPAEVIRCRHSTDQLEAARKAKGITARPTQQHFVFKPFWIWQHIRACCRSCGRDR
jgi:hypothetical protein